jgi:putative transcriptional regulator
MRNSNFSKHLSEEMNINSGTFLISTPALQDSIFEKTIIFIAEYNEQGSLGFVINNVFPRTLNELVEFKHSKAFPLFDGGPVEKEGLFFLHRRADVIEDGKPVTNSVYMGGNFKQAVTCINNSSIQPNNIKLFIGYCGWNAGELEAEIAEGSWLILDVDIATVFEQDTTLLWKKLYKTQQ